MKKSRKQEKKQHSFFRDYVGFSWKAKKYIYGGVVIESYPYCKKHKVRMSSETIEGEHFLICPVCGYKDKVKVSHSIIIKLHEHVTNMVEAESYDHLKI